MHNILLFFVALAGLSNLMCSSARWQPDHIEAHQVYTAFEKLNGHQVLRVVKDSTLVAVDEPTFAKINNVSFTDGTIEVKVRSRLLKTARPSDRGFIGVAFRIDEQNKAFEAIYLRPTNARADDQVRRNHSVQYFSYPDFKFDKLRKETPETYETYADMGLDEWITMRIAVKGKTAKLFLNNSKYPVFIVNNLKHGAHAKGGIGLWVDVGTEGFFKDLKIIQE